MIGLEPITCWLQISCSANWATSAYLHFKFLLTTFSLFYFSSLPSCKQLEPNDSYGNRTRVTAVKGRCLDRLTKEPLLYKKNESFHRKLSKTQMNFAVSCLVYLSFLNSPSRTWTYDSAVNSRVLYRLSYRGKHLYFVKLLKKLRFFFLKILCSFELCTFKTSYRLNFKPFLGQAFDLLVTVSYMHYCTSTSALSTL